VVTVYVDPPTPTFPSTVTPHPLSSSLGASSTY
jgi:hypothetical protein